MGGYLCLVTEHRLKIQSKRLWKHREKINIMEPEFTNEIKTIVENSVSTFATAAKNAKANNSMYARIFTWKCA